MIFSTKNYMASPKSPSIYFLNFYLPRASKSLEPKIENCEDLFHSMFTFLVETSYLRLLGTFTTQNASSQNQIDYFRNKFVSSRRKYFKKTLK